MSPKDLSFHEAVRIWQLDDWWYPGHVRAQDLGSPKILTLNPEVLNPKMLHPNP